MNLYEINFELQMAVARAEQEHDEGVIPEDLATLLDGLELARDVKIGHIARFIKSELAISEMIDLESKALRERAKTHENRAERLKAYLADCMLDGERYEDSTSKISWRKSESTVIDELAIIPAEFVDVVTVFKPKTAEIKKAIKSGETVPGASVVEKQNIQIK